MNCINFLISHIVPLKGSPLITGAFVPINKKKKLRIFKFSEKKYNLCFKYIFTSWNRYWICYILEKENHTSWNRNFFCYILENLSKWRGNKYDDLFTNIFLMIDIYYIINIKIPWKQHFLGKNYLECHTYFTANSYIFLFGKF